MFYQKVRYLLENNIRETLTQREDDIITKSTKECIKLYNNITDRERLLQEINLVVIRLVVEILRPVLHGRGKMLDAFVNIFTHVRSLNYTINRIIYDEFSNQQNIDEENEENAIKKIKLKIQNVFLTTVYHFTPGHAVEKDVIAYRRYRENEVYGLDKADKEVSSTFGDILGEL